MNLAAKPPGAAVDTFPRWVLFCAGGIIAFSLIAVGLVRITGNGPDQRAAAPTVQRSLLFQDQKDGGLLVADGRTGETLTVLHGEQGFTFHRMAYAGDVLRFEQRIEDIYDKKGGALEFVVRKTRVSNQRGEHVADLRAVTVLRHGPSA